MRTLLFATAVLAYLLVVGWLQPVGASFDGLSFLRAARDGSLDYGHALYLFLLRWAGVAGEGVDPVERAKWVSGAGAALAFACLWRAASARGASALAGGLVAAWFGLGTLVWQEAGSIEPTSWTIACLLLSAGAWEAYARSPRLLRLAVAMAAFGAALGFHVVSVCALPWLLGRAWPARRALLGAHGWIVLAGGLGLGAAAVLGGELPAHWRYWSGFVPSYAGGVVPELGRHLERGARLLGEGAPVLWIGAGVSGLALARAGSAGVREGLVLALPYLVAFLVFGRPLVALLVPALLAAALVVAHGAGRWKGPSGIVLLALGAGLECAVSLPQALAWARGPDEARERVELFARHVPSGAVLFAGPLANHFRTYRPDLDVVALPELWHQAFALDRGRDPIHVVRAAVRAAGRPCVLSSEGAGFLVGDLGVDPLALGLSLERALILPENNKLVLFPLDAGAPGPP